MAGNVLNEAQEQVVNHFDGPALTLAGPGSGKTTVLTERTVRLALKIQNPERILCVTFTNAAGEEMKKRYMSVGKEKLPDAFLEENKMPIFKTVHSFCNRIIGDYEKVSNRKYTRIEGNDGIKIGILRELYRNINGEDADIYILNQIGSLPPFQTQEPEIKNIKKIREAYVKYKEQNMLIDFDDMILIAADILNSDYFEKKRVRETIQEIFKYIQIDEAQDLTETQFNILKTVGISKNIFVVADDDQSIYGFRGAAPECLMSFYKNYSDCKLYRLSRNYRSTQKIVNISAKFISKNTERFEKNLYSEREKGSDILVKSCKNSIVQAEYIKDEICRILEKDTTMSVGVLYRNHISALLPGAVLIKSGMEFAVNEGAMENINMYFTELVLKEIRHRQRNKIFVPTPSKILRDLLSEGLEKQIVSYCRETRQHMNYKDHIISFLIYLCENCSTARDITSILDGFDNKKKELNDCRIFFSTVHSAKGLEYDTVFIIDAIMGEFPGKTASWGKLLEEERRLFYVALTRARKNIYVTYPVMRGNLYEKKGYEKESIFIRELLDEKA